MMSCASVQVWQNDGLPAQICNKCSAKLHISYQFKKQCEKSDAKLRQYIAAAKENKEQQQQQDEQMQQQVQNQQEQNNQQCEPRLEHQVSDSAGNCVFIECAPLIDLPHEETKFVDPFGNMSEPPPLIPINYNMPENHLNSCSLQTVRQVQVFNGTYTMPLQQMQPANIIQNQVITAPVHITSQSQIIHPPPQVIQPHQMDHQLNTDSKDRIKRNSKMKDNINDTNKQCSTCNKTSTGFRKTYANSYRRKTASM
ncbi:Zinc-finger associated domain (zf-AD) [Popillia japonica]|uniref:Zinc-finger associated domain (Zf-AD) n=1 Tax=Popillia japonica TaxID=7064 RepID=A0AAW1L6A3_POPJA